MFFIYHIYIHIDRWRSGAVVRASDFEPTWRNCTTHIYLHPFMHNWLNFSDFKENVVFFYSISQASNVHSWNIGKWRIWNMCYFEYYLLSVLYDQMTSTPCVTIMINMLFENQRKMQQITAFLINLNLKFEMSCFVLTSHNTSICSVVLTPHQLKIV